MRLGATVLRFVEPPLSQLIKRKRDPEEEPPLLTVALRNQRHRESGQRLAREDFQGVFKSIHL